MSVELNGSELSIHDVEAVSRNRENVSVSKEAWQRIGTCRTMIQNKIDAHEVMYGVTTGIGEFSEVVLSPEQVTEFQRFLIYSHAAGIGDAMVEEVVRGAMVGRINVHCHGNSGGRPQVTEQIVNMLNRGITPIAAATGSVGACGDLSPMSQIAMAMMGEGESIYDGKRMPSDVALESAGLQPLELEARDGLAIINGSNITNGDSCMLDID